MWSEKLDSPQQQTRVNKNLYVIMSIAESKQEEIDAMMCYSRATMRQGVAEA